MTRKIYRLDELDVVQNPALGAFVLWRFALSFQEDAGVSAPIPVTFLVLPLVLHKQTLDTIVSTRKNSGLSLFAGKLGERRENLLAVQERALALRMLTLQSLGVAATSSLLKIGYDDATTRAFELPPDIRQPRVPERLKNFSAAAEKLGYWFYKAGIAQVCVTLNVAF